MFEIFSTHSSCSRQFLLCLALSFTWLQIRSLFWLLLCDSSSKLKGTTTAQPTVLPYVLRRPLVSTCRETLGNQNQQNYKAENFIRVSFVYAYLAFILFTPRCFPDKQTNTPWLSWSLIRFKHYSHRPRYQLATAHQPVVNKENKVYSSL